MSKIILYTTDCQNCKVLETKLNEKNIEYTTCRDRELMADKGFRSAPMLEVDDTTYTFYDAVQLLKGM